MELKFKPQSTYYTCVQATQAIALNSFLGTDYSDLEVIAALENGFPLGFSILSLGQEIVRDKSNLPIIMKTELLEGIFLYLRQSGELPPLEKAIDTSINLATKEMESLDEIFRKGYAGMIEYLQGALKDNSLRSFYNLYIQHLDTGLFTPINYRFETVDKDPPIEKKFSGITILSENRLIVNPYNFDKIHGYNPKEDGILMFGLYRKVWVYHRTLYLLQDTSGWLTGERMTD